MFDQSKTASFRDGDLQLGAEDAGIRSVQWSTSAQELSNLLTAVQRFIYKLKASTLALGDSIQTLAAHEKRQLALELAVSVAKPLQVKLRLLYQPDDEEQLVRLASSVMFAFETQSVFEEARDNPSLELLSACHPEVLEILKHGMVNAFNVAPRLNVVLGERKSQKAQDHLVEYCRSLFKKRFLGKPLELTLNSSQLRVRNGRIVANLRPGVRWDLGMDAAQSANFQWHLRDKPKSTVSLVGRPELSFGASNRTISAMLVDSFRVTCLAT